MSPDLLLEHCRTELAAFTRLLDGDLSVPVRHCGSWDLYRLADHLGRQNLWSAAAVTEGHGDFTSARAPASPAALTAWFAGTAETLFAALGREPDAPAWTIFPPETVGFWRRRRAHETLVHRWDAEQALGLPSRFDDDLVADGINEVIDTMLPRQIALGRATVAPTPIGFEAPGFSTRWGTGSPVATVGTSREQLLLLLWKRAELTDPGVEVRGDRSAAAAFFDSQLVP